MTGDRWLELARLVGVLAVDLALLVVVAVLCARGTLSSEVTIAILSALAGGSLLRRPQAHPGSALPPPPGQLGVVVGLLAGLAHRIGGGRV